MSEKRTIFRFPLQYIGIIKFLEPERYKSLFQALLSYDETFIKGDEQLLEYYKLIMRDVLNIEKQVEAGKKGGRPKKNNPNITHTKPTDNPNITQEKPNNNLTITKEKDKNKDKIKENISSKEEASPKIVNEIEEKFLEEENNLEEKKEPEETELKNSESLKETPGGSTNKEEVLVNKEIPVPMSEIVKQKMKKYGDPEINRLLEIIEKYNEGIVDGTITEQRRYGKLLLDKLKKLDKVKSGQFTREDTLDTLLQIIQQNEYHRHKIAGPKKIFYNLAELIQIAKAEIEKQKSSEIPSF